jgi:two-component system alkaline phosphatase synthesis response regulator PhoP
VLRRYERAPADGGVAAGPVAGLIQIGALVIDIPGQEVRVEDRLVSLTFKEFELLQMLAENRGIVLTREQLLDRIWGYAYVGETRTVDVHIRYLRKKLGGEENRYIATIRGLGYKML